MHLKSPVFAGVALAAVALLIGLAGNGGAAAPAAAKSTHTHMVTVPEADRFTPFALTIRAGDKVEWVNKDTDDHTVVSDDPLNTVHQKGIDQPLPGTDSNSGQPGTYTLKFTTPGTFVYYCKFHSQLDPSSKQPIAPGPKGGIQDANGNYGTPMMGVITVLPKDD